MHLSSSLALLSATSLGQAAAFWRLLCDNPVTVGRYDPIVNPNAISGHVHTVAGGSGFGMGSTYASLRNSTCTSCHINQDKSAYWVPQLYYQNPNNGSFEDVPTIGAMTIYYLQRTAPNEPVENIKPFPPGFQMLAGSPMLRSSGNSLEQQAVNYVCLDYAKGSSSWSGLPSQNCPQGLRAQIVFPSCWDGKNLDAADHKSHMAYPWGVSTGGCPAGFPVRLMTVFIEVTFQVDQFSGRWYAGRDQPFVFSTGDPTGYGFHGDFQNGWDIDVLTKAIVQCQNLSGQETDCPLFDLRYGQNCHVTPQVNEVVSGNLTQLPGCNPVKFGPATATMGTCVNNTKPQVWNDTMQYMGNTAPPSAHFLANQPQTMQNYSTWNFQGCYTDLANGNRLLPNKVSYAGDMTPGKCLDACKAGGYGFGGLEYGKECYCSVIAPNATAKTTWQPCDMTCPGDSSSLCGGSAALQVYSDSSFAAPSIPQTSTDGTATYAGCYVDNIRLRVMPKSVSFNQTVDGCVSSCRSAGYSMAGVEYFGGECYCANSISSSATRAPDSDCNTKCGGDSTKLCGAGNRLQAYTMQGTAKVSSAVSAGASSTAVLATSSSAAVAAPTSTTISGYTYAGCYSDAASTRSLRKSMQADGTRAGCISACSKAGYTFAGMEYASECYCDNVLGANMLKAGETECDMACSGDKTTKCGGGNRLSLFNATALVFTTRQAQSNGMSYIGCYSDNLRSRAMTFIPAPKATMDSCTATCISKGYSFAGTEYGGECYCSKTNPTSALNPDTDCNMPCNDDNTVLCGAGNRLQVYKLGAGAAASSSASSSAPAAQPTALGAAAKPSSSTAQQPTSSSKSSSTAQQPTSSTKSSSTLATSSSAARAPSAVGAAVVTSTTAATTSSSSTTTSSSSSSSTTTSSSSSSSSASSSSSSSSRSSSSSSSSSAAATATAAVRGRTFASNPN